MNRAVFLDRDGVINEAIVRDGVAGSPRTLDEFVFCRGISDGLRQFAAAGFRVFVVSNQPDIARGLLDPDTLALMSKRVLANLPVDDVVVCPHDDSDGCECRKPKPGMIQRIAEREGIALADSYMIGDMWKDVEAGRSAGCRTILLRRAHNNGTVADYVIGSIEEAAQMVAHVSEYLNEVQAIASRLDQTALQRLVDALLSLRDRGGRLFVMGVGGSAANASHAVNDFRKIAALEAYCVTDNVSELTARINDDGWESAYAAWLHGSRLSSRDAVLVLSVGGGNREKNISVNLVRALEAAREAGATVLGIVGQDGGYTSQVADVCVLIPAVQPSRVTAHTEAFQAVVWHLAVSHPALRTHQMKWESTR